METSNIQSDVLAEETHAGRVWSLLHTPGADCAGGVGDRLSDGACADWAWCHRRWLAIGALGLVLERVSISFFASWSRGQHVGISAAYDLRVSRS